MVLTPTSFYYTMALYCTQEKHYHFNLQKQKKNSRYIYSNCSSTSEVHAALLLVEIYHNHKRVPLQELYERAMAKAKCRSA